MIDGKDKSLESVPVDTALLESANKWFDISWYGLIWAGGITALAALATVIFLFIQFWSSGVRERHADWRTSTLELETQKSKERTANLERDAEQLRVAAAVALQKANEADLVRRKIEEQLLVPRWLSNDQQSSVLAQLRRFPGIVAHIWIYPVGTPDTFDFALLLAHMMRTAGWETSRWTVQTGYAGIGGIIVTWRDGAPGAQGAAKALVDGLTSAQIDAIAPGAFEKDDNTIGPQFPATLLEATAPTIPPTIRIFVGRKILPSR